MEFAKRFLFILTIGVLCLATTSGTEGMRYLNEYFVYPDDENDQVKVHWILSTAGVIKEFALEKSRDNKEYTTWKTMEAPSIALSEVLEVDFDPYEGWSYYRLRQMLVNGDTLFTPAIPVFVGLDMIQKGDIMVPEEFLSEKTTTISLSSFNGKRLILVLRDQSNIEYLYDKEIWVDETGLYIEPNESLPPGKYTITASSQDHVLGLVINVH